METLPVIRCYTCNRLLAGKLKNRYDALRRGMTVEEALRFLEKDTSKREPPVIPKEVKQEIKKYTNMAELKDYLQSIDRLDIYEWLDLLRNPLPGEKAFELLELDLKSGKPGLKLNVCCRMNLMNDITFYFEAPELCACERDITSLRSLYQKILDPSSVNDIISVLLSVENIPNVYPEYTPDQNLEGYLKHHGLYRYMEYITYLTSGLSADEILDFLQIENPCCRAKVSTPYKIEHILGTDKKLLRSTPDTLVISQPPKNLPKKEKTLEEKISSLFLEEGDITTFANKSRVYRAR